MIYCIFSTVLFAGYALATTCDKAGTFKNEKGSFELSWCFPSEEEIQLTFTLDGNAFIGVGFGGSMYDADIVSGWIEAGIVLFVRLGLN